MTEAEWLRCGSRVFMRHQLRQQRRSPIRWVKFNLACVDRVRDLISDERITHLIRSLECLHTDSDVYALLDSTPNRGEVGAYEAIHELWLRHHDPRRSARIAAARAVLSAKWPTFATSEMVAIAFGRWHYRCREERIAHCDILRDIFGNPFRPVTFSPQWRTDTALSLARQMYESREFSAMPILADALQDAGCDSDDILNHCRGPGAHVRGCWVVDLVLGKS
jgi:hypothetical protein